MALAGMLLLSLTLPAGGEPGPAPAPHAPRAQPTLSASSEPTFSQSPTVGATIIVTSTPSPTRSRTPRPTRTATRTPSPDATTTSPSATAAASATATLTSAPSVVEEIPPFVVLPTPTDTPPIGPGLVVEYERSFLPASVPRPADLSDDVEDVLRSLLLGALLLLVVFPAERLNRTLDTHAEQLGLLLRRQRSRLGLDPIGGGGLAVLLSLAGAGLVNSFLDPELGIDRPSFALVVGMLGAVAVCVLASTFGAARRLRMRGARFRVNAYPGALALVLLAVVVSRLADYRPGFLVALVAGVVLRSRLDQAERGRAALAAQAGVLVAAVVAWLLWLPVQSAARDGDAGIVVLVLDALLATTFLAGVTAGLLGLVPLRYLPGHAVRRWSATVWAVLTGLVAAFWIHAFVAPDLGYDGALITVVALLALVALAAFVLESLTRGGTSRGRMAELAP